MVANDVIRIRAETAYPRSNPSARVRIETMATEVRQYGIILEYRPTLHCAEYATIGSTAPAAQKAVVLARALSRLPCRSQEGLLLVHRIRFLAPVPGFDPPSRVDIYDFDDALFVGSVGDANRRFAALKQEAARCRGYLRRARLVIAGNKYLAGHAAGHSRNVEVVPSCVDPGLLAPKEHREAETVTAGWIGSASTVSYLRPLLPILERINRSRLRIRLIVMGGDPRFRAPWLEVRRWSEAAELQALTEFDLGLMPIPDDVWSRGKCGYKLLLYGAAGLPSIASPVGVNRDIIGDNERGLLARDMGEWRSTIEQLAGDVLARRQIGAAARAFVEREFSYARWAPDLAGLIAPLAG